MADYTPSEVDRLAQIIRTADGNHDMGAGALAEAIADSGFLYDIRAAERAKAVRDEAAVHAESVRQVHELCTASTLSTREALEVLGVMEELHRLRDERAKRPDREQIQGLVSRLREQVEVGEDETLGKWAYKSRLMYVYRELLPEFDAVLSSFALEPEAREEPAPEHSYEAMRTDIISALAADGFAYLEAEQLVRRFEMVVRAFEPDKVLHARIRPRTQSEREAFDDGLATARMYPTSEVREVNDIDTRMLVLDVGMAPRFVGPFPNNHAALSWAREHAPDVTYVSSVMWPQRPEAAATVTDG